MKKTFIGMFAILFSLMIALSSCNGCKKTEEVPANDSTLTNVAVAELVVENLISTDRQDMYMNHAQDYRWFETCMMLNDFLDEENDGSLAEVVNVFQAVIERGSGFDTKVYKFQHFSDGTNVNDSINGFWVEDQPLNEEAIKLTYKEAYDKLMATNCPKPHSRYVTLRKQVGPIDANPQYIFGNLRETVFVDAVTGEVSDVNPAFGPNFQLSKPLGEWP